MSGAADSFLLYVFLRRLALPFRDTDAYKLGLIDAQGKRLRSPQTESERNADGPLDRVFLNLKRLLGSTSGGLSVIGTIAATSLLMREHAPIDQWNVNPGSLLEAYHEEVHRGVSNYQIQQIRPILRAILEELGGAPANSVGGGQIASVGIGPSGDPPGRPGRSTIARRKMPLKRKPMEIQHASKGTVR
jgi:hypothetical protein